MAFTYIVSCFRFVMARTRRRNYMVLLLPILTIYIVREVRFQSSSYKKGHLTSKKVNFNSSVFHMDKGSLNPPPGGNADGLWKPFESKGNEKMKVKDETLQNQEDIRSGEEEGTNEHHNPVEGRNDQNNPVERTNELHNPMERTNDQNNPVEITNQRHNPMEGTNGQKDPMEREIEPQNPMERPNGRQNPMERANDHNNPVEGGANEHQNPMERTNEQNSPMERAKEPQNPMERANEQKNPMERAIEPQNPMERTNEQNSPMERAKEPKNPMERANEQKNPMERAIEPQNPIERANEQNNPVERAKEPQNPMERANEQKIPMERAKGPQNPVGRENDINKPVERPNERKSPLARANEQKKPVEKADESKEKIIKEAKEQREKERKAIKTGSGKPVSSAVANMIMDMINRGKQMKNPPLKYNVTGPMNKPFEDMPPTCTEKQPPVLFSKMFKSFCWFENDCACTSQPSTLHCFPYFHMIGFPKTGSSDLYRRIEMHPEVIKTYKETNFFSASRFRGPLFKLEDLRDGNSDAIITENDLIKKLNSSAKSSDMLSYHNHFLKGIEKIKEEFLKSGEKRSTQIFGEGSITYAYSSLALRLYLSQVTKTPIEQVDCHVADEIRWLMPDAKLIVSMRNPVDRLYSDYRNLYKVLEASAKSPQDFHKRAVKQIEIWKQCVMKHDDETCARSAQFESLNVQTKVLGLARSMYVVHLRKWLEIFPRKQLLFVNFEDRMKRPKEVMAEIFNFLELAPVNEEKMVEIVESKFDMYEKLQPHMVGHGVPMLQTTRKLLEDFYRPFNVKLAKLLQSELYLWYDNPNMKR